MCNVNKYGLSRYIDSETKRLVRQKCGFGCVICGCSIYEYEHVDPVFSEAKEHNTDNIVLLCGTCHNAITRGIWSKEKVKYAAKNPICFQAGYAHHSFDIGNSHPKISIGNVTWIDTQTILKVMNDPILQISPPEIEQSPYRLSGIFCNKTGTPVLRIVDNELQEFVDNWDIEIVGPKLTIRHSYKGIALKLHFVPPEKIEIVQINMFHKGAFIQGNQNNGFQFIAPDNSQINFDKNVKGTFWSCEAGIIITENSVGSGYKCNFGKVE